MKNCGFIADKRELKSFRNSLHPHLIAKATNKLMAWMLIRNECHRLKISVPTLDQIELV